MNAFAHLALNVAATLLATAQSDTPLVEIQQNVDVTEHNYTWTLHHNHTAPLVEVRFDHFRVDTFLAPEPHLRRWNFDLTNKNSFGNKPGVCTLTPQRDNPGLRRGENLEFFIRVCPAGAPRGQGQIHFRFADGVETTLQTELPVPETFFAKNASLLGLGSIFGLFILFKALQSTIKRRPKTPATAA
jgi:hypothetical protein